MSTFVFARLANPDHKLPLPAAPGAFFPGQGLHQVDEVDPYFAVALADGSLVRATPDEIKAALAAAEAPSEPPAAPRGKANR